MRTFLLFKLLTTFTVSSYEEKSKRNVGLTNFSIFSVVAFILAAKKENCIKENDHDLNVNDPVDNNSFDYSKEKGKAMSNKNTKTKSPTTVILGDSMLKNVYGNTISKAAKFKQRVVVKRFSGAKEYNMKHYMKPTQEKPLAQIIFHIGTNDLVTNKDSDEIANEIV